MNGGMISIDFTKTGNEVRNLVLKMEVLKG